MIHPVHYQIFHGFSKDTGSPDPLSFVCFLFQILDQILGLLLISNDRRDLGLDVGADQMDGRRFCMDLYSVFVSLPDDLRLVKMDLFFSGLTTPYPFIFTMVNASLISSYSSFASDSCFIARIRLY